MESDDKTSGLEGPGKARKRKEPRPPLQPDGPAEEGAPAAGQGPAGAPAAKGGRGKRVSEVMTGDPVCCVPGTPLVKVARLMAENSCGAIPVIRASGDRTPAGMITARDVAVRSVALGRNPLEMTAGDVMSPVPAAVGPDDTLEACAETMRERKLRRLIVLDAAGCICGLVDSADLEPHLPDGRGGGPAKGVSRPPSST